MRLGAFLLQWKLKIFFLRRALIEQWTNDDPLKYVVKQSSVIKFNLVSDIFILNSIKQLKNGKAPGPDKIPTMLIKDAGEVICEPLAMIFNSSLLHGIFPNHNHNHNHKLIYSWFVSS